MAPPESVTTSHRNPAAHRRRVQRGEQLSNLGILAKLRGDYDGAEARYRQSLEIQERLGDQAGMATCYNNLGNLAELRGDYNDAEAHHRRSLEIKEHLGNQAGMAASYNNLGILARLRGN